MTEAEHEKIVLTGEKTYYGVNSSLSKRIIELQGDKGRLIDEINDWIEKADKAYSEKANAEIKLDEAKMIIKDLLYNSDEYCRQRAFDFLNKE